MKTYQIESFGDIDNLKLADAPELRAGEGEVLVRMRAASLNYRDLMVVAGTYGADLKSGLTPLSDGAGEVIEVGSGVSQWKAGDRVAGIFFQDWTTGRLTRAAMKTDLGGGIRGVLSQFVVFPASALVPLPAHLSWEEGACLPCAGVTVWHALQKGGLERGDTLLVLGTGGVSMFALQFARARGARVILTSSSDEKRERARSLGADETINYNQMPDWDKRVYELTNREGADQVIEVGGGGTWEKSLRCLRIGGVMSMIGGVAGFSAQVNPFPILFNSLTINGIYVGSREMFEAMNRALEEHRIKPIIDRVFPFEEARDALRYLQSGAHIGKVVISID